jgi:hypothetical protein
MWCALGTCFESLERRGDAIACFERAALFADHRDGAAALRLAKLYRQAGNVAAACRWYAVHVEEKEAGAGSGLGAGAAGSDVAEALLYLAGAAKAEGRVGREEREKESWGCARRAAAGAGGARSSSRAAPPLPAPLTPRRRTPSPPSPQLADAETFAQRVAAMPQAAEGHAARALLAEIRLEMRVATPAAAASAR